MGERHGRVLRKVFFQRLPLSAVTANFLAVATHGEQPLQEGDLLRQRRCWSAKEATKHPTDENTAMRMPALTLVSNRPEGAPLDSTVQKRVSGSTTAKVIAHRRDPCHAA